jgi:hypothetical protein
MASVATLWLRIALTIDVQFNREYISLLSFAEFSILGGALYIC